MAYNRIFLTFSYPEAKQYFEISTDGGQTYINGSNSIPIRYAADGTFYNYNFGANILELLFRRVNNTNFTISKILFNEVSELDTSTFLDYGIIGTGSQSAQGEYLAGEYVTYNNASNGGLKFTDFKTAAITGTKDMQLVLFVNGSIIINFRAESKTVDGVTLSCRFENNTGGNKTVSVGQVINCVTAASISFGDWNVNSYSFEYGVTKADVIGNTRLPAYRSQTGAYNWSLTIEEIIWNTSPAEIVVAPVSIKASLFKSSDTYWGYGRKYYAAYQLDGGNWNYIGKYLYEVISPTWDGNDTYVFYEYNGKWRIKWNSGGDPWNWPASDYGIEYSFIGKEGNFSESKTVDWHI